MNLPSPRILLPLIVMLFTASIAVGQSDPCAYPSNGEPEVVIDLRDGTVTGERRYALNDRVRIVFKNKNPFLYDYRFTVEENTVEESGLELFLSLSGLDSFAEESSEDSPDPETPTNPITPDVPEPSRLERDYGLSSLTSTEDSAFDQLNFDQLIVDFNFIKNQLESSPIPGLADDLDRAAGALRASQRATNAAVKTHQSAVRVLEKELKNPNAECQTLVASARSLVEQLKGSDLRKARAAFVSKQEKYRDVIGALRLALEDFKESMENLAAVEEDEAKDVEEDVARAVEPYQNRLEIHENWLAASLKGTLEISQTALTNATKAKTDIEKVLMTLQAFVDGSRVVGDFSLPTNVSIKVFRKATDAKEFGTDSFVDTTLNFGGGQRFVLAVGAAFSDLGQTRFQAVQGFETDRAGDIVLNDEGAPNLTRVVALEEESDSRVTPMLALHTRVGKGFLGFGGTYVTLGLNGNFEDDNNAVELLVGLSGSLVEDRFFITVGGYYGRQSSLEGDFYLGAALAEEMTEVPQRDDREWGIGIALSYRVR